MGRQSRAKWERRGAPLPPGRRTLAGDLRWGLGWGLFAGVFFGGLAALVLLRRGGVPGSAPPGVTAFHVVAVYPAAGGVGGVLLGALRPWVRTRRGAVAVGAVAVFPACLWFLRLIAGPFDAWRGAEWFAVLGGAWLLGAMGGYRLWALDLFGPHAPGGPGARPAGDDRGVTADRRDSSDRRPGAPPGGGAGSDPRRR